MICLYFPRFGVCYGFGYKTNFFFIPLGECLLFDSFSLFFPTWISPKPDSRRLVSCHPKLRNHCCPLRFFPSVPCPCVRRTEMPGPAGAPLLLNVATQKSVCHHGGAERIDSEGDHVSQVPAPWGPLCTEVRLPVPTAHI